MEWEEAVGSNERRWDEATRAGVETWPGDQKGSLKAKRKAQVEMRGRKEDEQAL